ncbi:MAG: sigma-70 family RNA polymerase sigma factor, partial [FCB group bacterium]|nr:sigma-70 family RNA polymerase sigma factor [FCB group bacterium]
MLNLFSESDAHLIQRTLGGDPSAFERLVDRYMQVVHAVAYAQTGNRADAEDAAQETFLKAYTALGSLQDRARFGPWIVTTARHKAIDLVRGRQRRHDLVNRLPQNGIVEVDFAESERHEQLREHLMALEEGPREVILLHYFAGKNLRDIARILQISRAAAQKRLCRARDTLSESVMRSLSAPVNAEKVKVERKRRIMAALATTSAPWKAAPPLATGASSLLAGATAKWMAAVG